LDISLWQLVLLAGVMRSNQQQNNQHFHYGHPGGARNHEVPLYQSAPLLAVPKCECRLDAWGLLAL
jgi:hypothetical protein